MKNVFKTMAAVAMMVAFFAFSSFAGTPAEETAKAVALINAYRADQGLPALKWDDSMSAGTAVRAQEASVRFEHIRPDGSAWYSVDPDRFYGENLGECADGNAEKMVQAWVASPIHRENIVGDYNSFNKSCQEIPHLYRWRDELALKKIAREKIFLQPLKMAVFSCNNILDVVYYSQ